MKLTSLEAEGIYGDLNLKIEFNPDLTFLIGPNGSGKTTALRLLMALLRPQLDELARLQFQNAAVRIADTGSDVSIRVYKSASSLSMSVSHVEERLEVSIAELQQLLDRPKTDESRNLILERHARHPAYRAIANLSTPMFLGLDRRFHSSFHDDGARRRLFMNQVHWERERERLAAETMRGALSDLSVMSFADLGVLIAQTMSEVLSEQEQLNSDFRNKLLTKAFSYTPTLPSLKVPSPKELQGFREKRGEIEKAAEMLRIPAPELQAALSAFVEHMDKLANGFMRGTKSGKKGGIESAHIADWMVNKGNADRIIESIALLEEYAKERDKLHEPIRRFTEIVNGFLVDTGKTVSVSDRGDLSIHRIGASPVPSRRRNGRVSEGYDERLGLSSGERQMLLMLGHLTLNKDLTRSGIFVVDEPELSLHIAWQERFVEAIQKANPRVQLVMATHSPAIVLERDEKCWELPMGVQ